MIMAKQRRFKLEPAPHYQPWNWSLRLYGRGVCSLAEGGPSYSNDREWAELCGQYWVRFGREPAVLGQQLTKAQMADALDRDRHYQLEDIQHD